MFCRMTGTLKEETGKARRNREKESKSSKKKVHSKDARDKAHDESALPLDVIEVIAKRLSNVVDYLHFRAANKLLRVAAPPIQWRSSSSMSQFDDLSMSPLFVFSIKDKVFTFVHPKHGLEYKYTINYPQSKLWNLNSQICCSKDGWILLMAPNKRFQVFFNPFTKELLPHPFANKEIMNIKCFGMSHSPTSSEFMAIELDMDETFQHMAVIKVHWLLNGAVILYDCREFPVYNISPVFHNGLFYCLSMKGNLGVFKATREKINWKEIEGPQAPYNKHFNNFLVECNGNLLAVLESSFGKGVRVFKLNESTMTWMNVESLQNHMLFVGNRSFSAVANIPGMENKIYFPRFYRQSVVFYSLDTNNYHTFKNDVVNFRHVKEHLNGCWIQPRWQ